MTIKPHDSLPALASKIIHEERDPGAELVSELALLSHDPKTRLAELEEFWKTPTSVQTVVSS